MTELDEIGLLARRCTQVRAEHLRDAAGDCIPDETALEMLASAVLAMLPVVRAAAACRDSPDDMYDEADAFREVCDAIDQMRAALKRGG